MSAVFVTGASGFIGGKLAERLAGRGDDVLALARSPEAAATVAGHGARPVAGHVLDEEALAAGMAGCEVAFHVAGENSHCPADADGLLRTNVEGTATVLRAAARAGVRRVVLTSSSATCGEAHGTVATEDTVHRGTYLSVYDRSKHEAELVAFAAGRAHGVEVVAVNPSSVQGPGRAKGNGKLVLDYLNGSMKVFLDTHLSICDVDDCIEGHMLAAERGAPGSRYVLNSATIESFEALRLLAELSGIDERPRILPFPALHAVAIAGDAVFKARGGVSPYCRARVRTLTHGHRYDGSRAERELGIAYTTPRETFRRIMVWGVEQGLVTRPLPALA